MICFMICFMICLMIFVAISPENTPIYLTDPTRKVRDLRDLPTGYGHGLTPTLCPCATNLTAKPFPFSFKTPTDGQLGI